MVTAMLPVGIGVGMFSLVSFVAPHTGEGATPAEIELHNSQTMPLLRAALNIDPNPAKGGGEITIDKDALLADVGPAGSLADIEDRPPASDQISLYVVDDGDTLSQIGEMFNVSVNTIRWANDIGPGESIHPGQTLVILPISGIRHTVEKGDTLRSIAKEYEGDLEEILSFNNLHADAALSVGEVIVVPDAVMGETTPTVSSPTRVATPSGSTSSGGSTSGYFINPVPGSVRTQGIHGYNGVDLGARTGAQVLAAASGDVIIARGAGWNGGYGTYIVVRHANGTQTLYAHLSSLAVYGGSVVQGQVIGYVGQTGRSTGPHLHFEVRGASNPF